MKIAGNVGGSSFSRKLMTLESTMLNVRIGCHTIIKMQGLELRAHLDDICIKSYFIINFIGTSDLWRNLIYHIFISSGIQLSLQNLCKIEQVRIAIDVHSWKCRFCSPAPH